MRPFLAFMFAMFMANSVFADPYSAAIQQARRVANQETEANRRLMNNSPPATPPQNSPNQPANPVLQATLQNIQNLQSDFATLARLTNAAAVTVEKQGLTNDLATAAQGAKPSSQSLSKLADDLVTVIVGNTKLRAQHLKLAQYLHAIANSSHLSEAQRQMIFSETQHILVAGGTAPDDVANVVNDIKAISSETRQE
jgi:hypothetical protein